MRRKISIKPLLFCIVAVVIWILAKVKGYSGYDQSFFLIALVTLLYASDFICNRLLVFNKFALGLLSGAFMGNALVKFIEKMPEIGTVPIAITPLGTLTLYLVCSFFGIKLAFRASQELAISIPFIRFSSAAQKTRGVIVDQSALEDPRLIELCRSGILDHRLAVPRFLLKEIRASPTAHETLKQLENLQGLSLKIHDGECSVTKSSIEKIFNLCLQYESDLLTTDSSLEDSEVNVINLHRIASAMKPLKRSGETVTIKVQRPGKESDQGVGYLEDGTMVVINGGRDFIGQTVETNLISIKHTGAGRILFCGIKDEEEERLRLNKDGLNEALAYE